MTTDPGSGMGTPSPPESQPPESQPPAAAPPAAAPPASGPPATVPPAPAPAAAPAAAATTAPEPTAEVLRSMLSRAAADQLVEQREIADAIGEMRNQLTRLGQELAEMRSRQPRDDLSDAQINSVTVEMRESARYLSERIDGVTRMVVQRGEDLADIRAALAGVDEHVRAQAETIGVLSAGLQSLPSYGERVSVLQDNLAIVHRQLVGIEGILASNDENPAEERLAFIETWVAPLTRQLDDVAGASSTQSESLSGLQSTLAELKATVAEVQGRIDPLASDITAIGSGVTGLVEGTADGAALDSRVRESVGHAMRDTEQRLIDHIDEAILALAQTLLRRRPASVAGQFTGQPVPVVSEEPTEVLAEPTDILADSDADPDVATDLESDPAANTAPEVSPDIPRVDLSPLVGGEDTGLADYAKPTEAVAPADPPELVAASGWLDTGTQAETVGETEPETETGGETEPVADHPVDAQPADGGDPDLAPAGESWEYETAELGATVPTVASLPDVEQPAPYQPEMGTAAPDSWPHVATAGYLPADSEDTPADTAPADTAPVDTAPVDTATDDEWSLDAVLIGDAPAPEEGSVEGEQEAAAEPHYIESTPAWAPETPPERPPVEATIVPEEVVKRKRRWF